MIITSGSFTIQGNGFGVTSESINVPAPPQNNPTYSFSSVPSSINEGSAGTFNISTTNVSDGTTLYWTISNLTTVDADFSAVSGSFTINSGTGSFNITPVADLTTEGSQTFAVQIRTGSISGSVVATSDTITVNDTSVDPLPASYSFSSIPSTITENTSGTFNVTTTNVNNGTVLYWTINHGNTVAADFVETSNSFTISSNAGSFNVTANVDYITEVNEYFTVSIRTGSISGNVVNTSANVTIINANVTGNVGQQAYIIPGTYTWTAPANVTKISVLTIGAGGGGAVGGIYYNGYNSGGGGGGGLAYINDYDVTPGNTYTVVVGAGGRAATSSGDTPGVGGDSYFINSSFCKGAGGGIRYGDSGGGIGGSYTVVTTTGSYGGGNGGNGGNCISRGGAGGGGAGGYSGNGGRGGDTNNGNGTNGAGGGGGGGAGNGYYTFDSETGGGGAGGGTGIYGSGSNGTGATANVTTIGSTFNQPGGGGGSGGGQGGSGINQGAGGLGGSYGGGGGGSDMFSGSFGGNGAGGAVRIIWGSGRSFPSTNAGDV